MFLADFHQGLVAVGLAALKQLQRKEDAFGSRKNRKGCIGQALAGPLRCKLGTPKEIICLQIISNLCALHADRTSLFPLFLLVCVLARILCNREAALVKASCAWRRITNLCSRNITWMQCSKHPKVSRVACFKMWRVSMAEPRIGAQHGTSNEFKC